MYHATPPPPDPEEEAPQHAVPVPADEHYKVPAIGLPERDNRSVALSQAIGLGVAGLVLIGIGIAIAAAQYPHYTFSQFSGRTLDGSRGGYLAGLAIAAVGGLITQVCVIAFGVELGNKMGRPSSDPTRSH